MRKFLGFALMELTRATGDRNDLKTARTYDVTIYNKFGEVLTNNLKLSEIERDWGHFRRTGDSYGIMDGSTVRVISEDEFMTKLAEWKAAKESKVA